MLIEACVETFGRAAMIYDAAAAARAPVPVERWFDPAYRLEAGTRLGETTGRGAVMVLDHGTEKWVLRHYNRGGFVAHFVADRYVWTGLERSRAFREWRLLARLRRLGLPVPRPVAARVVRTACFYRADIATAYLPDTRPLSAHLDEGGPAPECWTEIGRMLRAFHDTGVEHPDLTAHNILIGAGGEVYLVDFDNARVRPQGPWRRAGLARLQRSLRKVALETGTRFDPAAWQRLETAYAEAEPARRADP